MFCPQFAPVVGGAERQAERLGQVLRRDGIDVRVLTPHLSVDSPNYELRDGLAVHRFPLSDLSKRFSGFRGIGALNAPWIVSQVACRVWREAAKADVVHCHVGSLQSVAAAMAARLRGVPVLCKAAIADEKSDLGEALRAGVTGRVVAWAGKRAFTRWVATTGAVKDALLRGGVDARRIVIIPNGVAVRSPSASRQSRPVRRFLYLGRLSTNIERDVPSLVRAFDRLVDDVDDAELAVVGSGDLLQATRDLAHASRHSTRIQVPGHGDPDTWLAWADCFVLPSQREGLSNALLEAMAAELPCIANDIPSNREVLGGGEFGLLVPVGDAQSLLTAMQRVATDSALAARLALLARRRAESDFSIASVARRYRDLYATLLERASPPHDSR